MNIKKNKLYRDTELRMQAVTLELMKCSDIDHITVRAICEKAHVNRSTFYEHFTDVYDMFRKMELELHDKLMEQYARSDGQAVKAFTPESFLPLFRHVREHRYFYRIALRARKEFPIEHVFELSMNDVIRPLCESAGITDESEILYYLGFFQAGFTVCLRRWVDNDCRESEQELTRIISNCIPNMFSK